MTTINRTQPRVISAANTGANLGRNLAAQQAEAKRKADAAATKKLFNETHTTGYTTWFKGQRDQYNQIAGANFTKDFAELDAALKKAPANGKLTFKTTEVRRLLNAIGNKKPVNTAATTTPEPKKDFFGQVGDFLKGALKFVAPVLKLVSAIIPGAEGLGPWADRLTVGKDALDALSS
jgi:hypothetical protein